MYKALNERHGRGMHDYTVTKSRKKYFSAGYFAKHVMKKIREKCRVNMSCLVIVNFAYENTLYCGVKVLSLSEKNKHN